MFSSDINIIIINGTTKSNIASQRKVLQPAAKQMGRVQSDGYGRYVGWYVSGRTLLQPAAQQVERVQRGGYELYV